MNDFPQLPEIRTALPGPKAKAIIQRDDRVLTPSFTRPYPLVAGEARGAVVRDPDGNFFLDFAAGIAVVSTGHCHPKVVEAVREQAGRMLHMSGADFYNPPMVEAAERLASLMPGKERQRVYFGNSGAEAVECAIKLAKYHTGRKRFIAFFGAFHGRTTGALALTASKAAQKERFFPLMDGVTHVPYANCARCAFGKIYGKCSMECLAHIEETVFKTIAPPEEVAAIVMEPLQGEGGYVVPPPEFVRGIRSICDKHGILLIDDEIQAGMGRTGRFLAIEHYDVTPDVVCLAKGIASGLPLSACVAPETVMDWAPGSHASTFGGNPVSCAASLVTMELLEGGLMKNAREQGDFLMAGLKAMMGSYEVLGEVRGRGLMIGVEVVRDRVKQTPYPELRNSVVRECFEQGLLILGCGTSTLRVCPPLIIDRQQAAAFLEIFERALRKALKTVGYKDFPF